MVSATNKFIYINRYALLNALDDAIAHNALSYEGCVNDIMTFIAKIPAANVQPVVLCRDCEMANPCSDDREMYCTLNHCYKKNDYFCADGRRKMVKAVELITDAPTIIEAEDGT